MAGVPSEYHHGDMDIHAQAQTFHAVMIGTKWASLAIVVGVLFLTLWFCTAAGFFTALVSAIVLVGMVVGLLLIVAVGSNYCLFFERTEPVPIRQRAIASIALANLCTVCAYGLMAFSRIPVLHDIGLTVAIGTFLSLVCGAVLSREPAPC